MVSTVSPTHSDGFYCISHAFRWFLLYLPSIPMLSTASMHSDAFYCIYHAFRCFLLYLPSTQMFSTVSPIQQVSVYSPYWSTRTANSRTNNTLSPLFHLIDANRTLLTHTHTHWPYHPVRSPFPYLSRLSPLWFVVDFLIFSKSKQTPFWTNNSPLIYHPYPLDWVFLSSTVLLYSFGRTRWVGMVCLYILLLCLIRAPVRPTRRHRRRRPQAQHLALFTTFFNTTVQ